MSFTLAISPRIRRRWPAIAAVGVLHCAAFGMMFATEYGPFNTLLFLLVWCLFNSLWIAVLARPVLAAVLSLSMVALIIALSLFKYGVLWMTIDFFDILVIDPDTFRFLLTALPEVRTIVIVSVLTAGPVIALLWILDPLRVPRRLALVGALTSFAAIVGVSLTETREPSDAFFGINHVSGFAHSGVTAAPLLATRTWFDADPPTGEMLRAADTSCQPAVRPPHIILILDESSFDARMLPGVRLPAGYGSHFKSFDGRQRALLVEGAGGPTWYSEYNVLTGLSARSYGRFSYQLTRLAAGHVERGLPQALKRCGYQTVTQYPAHNAFLSAKRFQHGTGIDRMLDARDTRQNAIEPDSFFYSHAIRHVQAAEQAGQPLFLFAYTQANHFPWSFAFRPDLTPDWRAPGNGAELDEYLRRQSMSERDYRDFVAHLRRDHPKERFLIVRFGDHQPPLAARLIDPKMDDSAIMQRVLANDPRYLTTYYAIDPINFTPADLSSALDPIDAAYLPIVIQEAAGLPLDPTFAEQKRIMRRCGGVFALCAGGSEVRRFNRLMIEAGLIKGFVSR